MIKSPRKTFLVNKSSTIQNEITQLEKSNHEMELTLKSIHETIAKEAKEKEKRQTSDSVWKYGSSSKSLSYYADEVLADKHKREQEREARSARYALEVKLSSLSAQMGVQNKKLDALKKQQASSSSESGKMWRTPTPTPTQTVPKPSTLEYAQRILPPYIHTPGTRPPRTVPPLPMYKTPTIGKESLLNGTVNETENRESFLEALEEWRAGNKKELPVAAEVIRLVGNTEIADKNSTGTETVKPITKLNQMEEENESGLTYLEKLLVTKCKESGHETYKASTVEEKIEVTEENYQEFATLDRDFIKPNHKMIKNDENIKNTWWNSIVSLTCTTVDEEPAQSNQPSSQNSVHEIQRQMIVIE